MGNQAQKWKVDKIKRLLVRASDPLETKYIVRSLQGKLRIGLAESTVLISLAHSWALTTPKTVELSVDELGKGEFLHHRFSCCLGD
jgi:DNA ligase-1